MLFFAKLVPNPICVPHLKWLASTVAEIHRGPKLCLDAPLAQTPTLQCDTWLWDDMPLNSPKRPPYWNSTSGFHFHTSLQSTYRSVPVCEILSKSDYPWQKKMTSCRFSRCRISAILDCRDPIMGSLKSPVKLT